MEKEFIGIGMYSINDELERAWQDLFLIAGKLSPGLGLPIHFLNSIEENDIVSSQTRISHICGLPLVSQFQKKLIPICTPHFDLEGLEGPNYFSYFMVSKKSQIRSVTESKGLVAAISSYDSQSGSNVFRSEIEVTKKLDFFDNFYKKIVTTGSHKNSIQKIINNEVDIACIDAISYKNIKRAEPEIGDKLRIIGRSILSPAPPLVTHKDNPLCSSRGLIIALNSALNLLDKETKDVLRIKRFSFVPFDTYNSHIKKV